MSQDRYASPGVGSTDSGALAAFGFDALPVVRVTLTDPAVSERQRKFMAVCAHDPAHARGQCPDRKTAREFSKNPTGGSRA